MKKVQVTQIENDINGAARYVVSFEPFWGSVSLFLSE